MKTLLTVNYGSSSLKASLFRADGSRKKLHYAHLQNHAEAFEHLLRDLGDERPQAVGHRFVHGGNISQTARRIDPVEFERLEKLVYLAPLHLPANLLGVKQCVLFNAPQIACFDTAFHATLPELAWRLPIPTELGYRRYGFHGINYTHVARRLPELIGKAAQGRIVVAHLGSGSSLCLMNQLRSQETTMGYTPAGGIPMGTRSGDLDPGVMLELAKKHDVHTLSKMVYQQMGLLALSDGLSADVGELLQSRTHSAEFALRYFVRRIIATVGSYAALAGGIDALVFTGGIGEHAATIRADICQALGFLGIVLDNSANQNHSTIISTEASIPVLIVPADEELEIARLTLDLTNCD